MRQLKVRITGKDGTSERALAVCDLVIAGWTGRDKEAMKHHIAELEAIGVKRPPGMPMYYRVSLARLTVEPIIEVLGPETSGEVEFVLVALDGELYIGVGSDHTDRKLETSGISISKQVCDKPIADTFWPFKDVAEHWDRLILRSHVVINGGRQLYQEGSVVSILSPNELIDGYANGDRLKDTTVMFGGTLPARGGIRPAERFEGELEDPVLKRRIAFYYDVRQLPDNG
jgi:hypothetical protein